MGLTRFLNVLASEYVDPVRGFPATYAKDSQGKVE